MRLDASLVHSRPAGLDAFAKRGRVTVGGCGIELFSLGGAIREYRARSRLRAVEGWLWMF